MCAPDAVFRPVAASGAVQRHGKYPSAAVGGHSFGIGVLSCRCGPPLHVDPLLRAVSMVSSPRRPTGFSRPVYDYNRPGVGAGPAGRADAQALPTALSSAQELKEIAKSFWTSKGTTSMTPSAVAGLVREASFGNPSERPRPTPCPPTADSPPAQTRSTSWAWRTCTETVWRGTRPQRDGSCGVPPRGATQRPGSPSPTSLPPPRTVRAPASLSLAGQPPRVTDGEGGGSVPWRRALQRAQPRSERPARG